MPCGSFARSGVSRLLCLFGRRPQLNLHHRFCTPSIPPQCHPASTVSPERPRSPLARGVFPRLPCTRRLQEKVADKSRKPHLTLEAWLLGRRGRAGPWPSLPLPGLPPAVRARLGPCAPCSRQETPHRLLGFPTAVEPWSPAATDFHGLLFNPQNKPGVDHGRNPTFIWR